MALDSKQHTAKDGQKPIQVSPRRWLSSGDEKKGGEAGMKIKTLEEVRERVERALKRVYPDSAVGMMIDIDDLYAINDALKLLKEQPKIVRCADCKYCERINGINGCGYRCELWEYSSVLKDGFCNYGERKDKQNG